MQPRQKHDGAFTSNITCTIKIQRLSLRMSSVEALESFPIRISSRTPMDTYMYAATYRNT